MDLKERYDWAESHPKEAREISERATELIRSLGTNEGFEVVYKEFYEEPLRQVVNAYKPLSPGASWRDLVQEGNDDGLHEMAKCGGLSGQEKGIWWEADDCEGEGEKKGGDNKLSSRHKVQRGQIIRRASSISNGSKEQPPAINKNGPQAKDKSSQGQESPDSSSTQKTAIRPEAPGRSSIQKTALQSVEHGHPRTTFISSKGTTCEYLDCSISTSKFENEMGEFKEPPTEEELPPLDRYDATCVQGRAWHSLNPVNCNMFHEVETGLREEKEGGNRIKFLAHGGRRDAWELDRSVQEEQSERIILKTLRWDHLYEEKLFDNQRRDALALERLTNSPHVVDVFGFCGMSTLNEFAGNGNLYSYLTKHKEVQPEDLLVYARNITMGLADIHELDIHNPDEDSDGSPMPPDMPSLLHYDFRHHNMLMIDDYRVKISDFNIAQLLRWDTAKEETCGYKWYKVCGRSIWGTDRAPEECVEKANESIPSQIRRKYFTWGIY